MKTAPITGHRMSRNRHNEPVATITLVGAHRIYRFADRMFDAQCEFGVMGAGIMRRPPAKTDRRGSDLVDGFRKYELPGGDLVVVITLVGWHSIHRFAYNMLRWQVEFAEMGRKILKSHRRAVGKTAWCELWAMYHGTAEKPLTFHWGRDV